MTARATLKALRAAIRSGFYAWPGGYQMLAVMSDGESLCCKCARENYRRISWSTRNHEQDGWGCEGVQIHWEGHPEYCVHCNAAIPSVYGPVTAQVSK